MKPEHDIVDQDIPPVQRVINNFNESAQTIQASSEALAEKIAQAAQLMTDSMIAGGKLLVCGNGGSAADAQHFSAEMLNRFEMERPGLPAVALNTDGSTLTSIANDYHYDEVFAKQVQALGQPRDVLIVITSSGNSTNVIKAVNAAHNRSLRCIALNGGMGGELSRHMTDKDIDIVVSGRSTARIQEVHGLIIHCFCDLIDRQITRQS